MNLMGKAKKCDRCGAFYQEIKPQGIAETLEAALGMMLQKRAPEEILIKSVVDLCTKCENELHDWWTRTGDLKDE